GAGTQGRNCDGRRGHRGVAPGADGRRHRGRRRQCESPVKISELFAAKRRLFSFEFFPPKTDAGGLALERTIRELAELQPAFVSVTYGAGGSTRTKTIDLVQWIQREARLTAMAPLTCGGGGRDDNGGMGDPSLG